MNTYPNRSAYVRSPWSFDVRDNPVSKPGAGQLLLEVAACAVCGSDFHLADRLAPDWKGFGHEVSGVVREVGEGVTSFVVGDRVALDSAAPCGKCQICLPEPYGRERPDLCRTPATYWDSPTMGFGEFMLAPYECAVHVPDTMPMDVASLVEPIGVSIDLVKTAEIRPRDNVLIIGPGPLGLGALVLAKRAGAEHVSVAGLSTSVSRLHCAEALGADEIIKTDETPLATYHFGNRAPDRILVTAPPSTLLEAIHVAAYGGLIAYIGIAYGPGSVITFDADEFHFRKLSMRSSFASPGIHAAKSIRVLEDVPELGKELISHRFKLEEIGTAFTMARDDRELTVRKTVMVAG